ncbi:tetratricopeptide repeat protein [Parvularcula oceani]|uniref:tetratricopeptide repeat protein n=1 Tax=Parvularcula oceani TaxID=1247963 RepID=UPI000A422A18|nr:tetratricopeptide repeat protein [Parvularcula oceani]
MKSNVPWSVKGIDPEARAVAKKAAREAGMTLGEWMNRTIREVGEGGERAADAPAAESGARTGVTTDQLRAVVDSLNRLNERLKSTEEGLKDTEEKSRQVVGGLNQGLETVFERIKRLERERAEGADAALAGRLEKLERGEGDKSRVAGLKALEGALTHMVEALENTRTETLERVAQNEETVAALSDRVEVLDSRLTAGFSEVYEAIDAVGLRLDKTEESAREVLAEAQEAANSTDAEFVERTSARLQILGNEIKRSGDQIRSVEDMVSRLSEKIEAAEHRSAEGIGEVAASLDALRHAVTGPEGAQVSLGGSLAEAAQEAERKVSALQRSYESMMARLEGKPEPEGAVAATSPADGEEWDDEPRPLPLAADSLDGDVDPGDAEFDAVFGSTEPSQPLRAEADPQTTAPLGNMPEDDAGRSSLDKLTPQQKVLLAAKVRQKRLQAERDGGTGGGEAAAAPAAVDEPARAAQLEMGESLPEIEEGEERSALRDRPDAAPARNRRIGGATIALAGALLLGVAAAGAVFFGDFRGAPVSEPAEAVPAASRNGTPGAPAPAPIEAPAAVDAAALYREGLRQQAAATNDQEAAEALALIREAAAENYVPAWYEVGNAYFNGLGVPTDLSRAKRWFQDAALSGNVKAMHRLGTIAIQDPAGGQNMTAALDWFDRAASYGVVDSMYNLGYLYDPASPGNPLPTEERDAARSYYWYALAGSQGDAPAQQDAQAVAARLTPEKVAEIDAEVAAWERLAMNSATNDGTQINN